MKILLDILIAGTVGAAALSASTVLAADKPNEEAQTKKPKKITDRRDPNYVRCRSEAIIGSLARKRRICMTNAEWAEYISTGSRNAKEFVEDNQPGFMLQPQ